MSAKSDKTPPADIEAGAERAAAKVPEAVDRAGDNTPTKPGTEASRASSGSAQTRPDSAQVNPS